MLHCMEQALAGYRFACDHAPGGDRFVSMEMSYIANKLRYGFSCGGRFKLGILESSIRT